MFLHETKKKRNARNTILYSRLSRTHAGCPCRGHQNVKGNALGNKPKALMNSKKAHKPIAKVCFDD